MQKQPLYLKYSIALTTLFVLFFIQTKAQNVSSPYSILGIGDIDTKDYGRYFADGGCALGRRDPTSYNSSNPASLTSLPYSPPLKQLNFDISMRGRFSNFQVPGSDTTTAISKDFTIKRVALSYKLNDKLGVAVGFKPFSTVSYQSLYTLQIPDANNNSYFKSVDGSGGINQVYISAAREFGKHFSIGLTAAYLFGSLQNTVTYASPVDVTRKDINTLYGAGLTAGIQYYTGLNKKDKTPRRWQHQVGLTVSVNSPLNGQLTTDYLETNNTADSLIPEKVASSQFLLPATIGFGYTAIHNNRLLLSCEVSYSNWPTQMQTLDYTNYYTTSTFRAAAGIEYSYKKKYNNAPGEYEKYYLAMGASVENSYFLINNNFLKDYSFTAGGGVNVSGLLSFFGAIEYGIRGDINLGQIKETHTGISFGISLSDRWISTKKFGRFN